MMKKLILKVLDQKMKTCLVCITVAYYFVLYYKYLIDGSLKYKLYSYLLIHLVFPSLLEDMIAGGISGTGMNDNFSSGSSSNSSFESVGDSSRSFTPLSDTSNDASYDAGGNSDPENIGA
jgi:hypothetical protein